MFPNGKEDANYIVLKKNSTECKSILHSLDIPSLIMKIGSVELEDFQY